DEGIVEVVQPATHEAPEETVMRFGPGSFLGELNMLTGQAVYLLARVVEPGRIHRITSAAFRRLMSEDSELADIVLEAYRARRVLLRHIAASCVLVLVVLAMV